MEPIYPQESVQLADAARQLLENIQNIFPEDPYCKLYRDFITDLHLDSILVTQPYLLYLRDTRRLNTSKDDDKAKNMQKIQQQYTEHVQKAVSDLRRMSHANLFQIRRLFTPWAEYAVFDVEEGRATHVEHIDCGVSELVDLEYKDFCLYYHELCYQELDEDGQLHSFALYTQAKRFCDSKAAFGFYLMLDATLSQVEMKRRAYDSQLQEFTGELSPLTNFNFSSLIHFRLEVVQQLQQICEIQAPKAPEAANIGYQLAYAVSLHGFIQKYVDCAAERMIRAQLSEYFAAKAELVRFDIRQVVAELQGRLGLLLYQEQCRKWAQLGSAVSIIYERQKQTDCEIYHIQERIASLENSLKAAASYATEYALKTAEELAEYRGMVRWCMDSVDSALMKVYQYPSLVATSFSHDRPQTFQQLDVRGGLSFQ